MAKLIPDTQRAAHDSIKPDRAALQAIVINTLKAFPDGLTTEEITDLSEGQPYANIQPRTSELRDAGIIRDSGGRRPAMSGKKIIVWTMQ